MKCMKRYIRSMTEKELCASATVEAAFIFPVIIFIIIAYIWLLFFMYARIKLEADVDMALEKALEYFTVTGGFAEDVIPGDHLERYIRDYPYCRLDERTMTLEKGTVSIIGGLNLKVPKGGLTGRFTLGLKTIHISEKQKYYDRAQIKRISSVTKKMLAREEAAKDDSD